MNFSALPVPAPIIEEIPPEVLANPALLFLYHRIEAILGIRALYQSLLNLNTYLEKICGASFVENPAAHERMLASPDQIFEISKLVTVNETYFFREGAHFKLLARHFLPRLSKLNRPIRICSAATSIGCEAYSIAMLLDYHLKKDSADPFEFEIDAFDVSAEAIETARNARYTANTLRSDGCDWKYILDLYLAPDGGEFVVSCDIQNRVRFFSHNIMNSLNRQYDIIFFRNAMIYFSPQNRNIVMDTLASSLFNDGVLFLGVSETSSVRHPLLASKCHADVFYFQKAPPPLEQKYVEHHGERHGGHHGEHDEKNAAARRRKHDTVSPKKPKTGEVHVHEPARKHSGRLAIDCEEAARILEKEEGQENARQVLSMIETAGGGTISVSGGALAAAAASYLGAEDFDSAGLVLSYLEHYNSGAVIKFLRGEYHFLRGNAPEAEKNFEEAAAADKAFWPALYRISSLAAQGNRTRYEYKIKKARESLELGKALHYECFLGGFSPDYFRGILDKKLT
jgi:chemotaxis protein methyltransferase CheR